MGPVDLVQRQLGWGGQTSAWWDQSWGPVWSQHRSQGRDDTTAEIPELLPPFLQGWFLLQDSGLDIHERNSIQTALRGDMISRRWPPK